MMPFVFIAGLALLSLFTWFVMRGRNPRSGPHNNWKNEDFMARESDGTWAEGSKHPREARRDSSGIGIE